MVDKRLSNPLPPLAESILSPTPTTPIIPSHPSTWLLNPQLCSPQTETTPRALASHEAGRQKDFPPPPPWTPSTAGNDGGGSPPKAEGARLEKQLDSLSANLAWIRAGHASPAKATPPRHAHFCASRGEGEAWLPSIRSCPPLSRPGAPPALLTGPGRVVRRLMPASAASRSSAAAAAETRPPPAPPLWLRCFTCPRRKPLAAPLPVPSSSPRARREVRGGPLPSLPPPSPSASNLNQENRIHLGGASELRTEACYNSIQISGNERKKSHSFLLRADRHCGIDCGFFYTLLAFKGGSGRDVAFSNFFYLYTFSISTPRLVVWE